MFERLRLACLFLWCVLGRGAAFSVFRGLGVSFRVVCVGGLPSWSSESRVWHLFHVVHFWAGGCLLGVWGAAFRALFPVACFFSRGGCLLRVWWAGIGAFFHVTHSGGERAFLRFWGAVFAALFCVACYDAGGCLLGVWGG